MLNCNKIHIIDSDQCRRAKLSRSFYNVECTPEIYERVDEFVEHVRTTGLVFAHDSVDRSTLFDAFSYLESSIGCFPVIMYSEEPKLDDVTSAMLDGAIDYLSWRTCIEDLANRIDQIQLRARDWYNYSTRRSEARARVRNLSRREEQVIRKIVAGLSNKQIAAALEISPRTVEIHRANAMKKIAASSSAEAVKIGLYSGLDQDVMLQAA